MLVAVEQVTALAWDTAQAADAGDAAQAQLSAVLAGAFALDAYVECAKGCIQILGGMGFTWEHDAHLHLRRALTLRQLVGAERRACGSRRTRAALDGSRRRLALDLPEDAERVRERGPRRGGRGGRRARLGASGAGVWSRPGCSRRTGPCHGDAAPGPSSSW